MKQILSLILTLCLFTSCVTATKTFLVHKHRVEKNEISIIKESVGKSTYSPFFDLKSMLDYTDWYVTNENYDSVVSAYEHLKQDTLKKNNCIAYDVIYKYNKDTIRQRVYFIENRNYQVTHDNDILNRMKNNIEHNLSRFVKIKDNMVKSINGRD